MMAKRSTSVLQRIRVPLGFAFAALFIVFAEPTWGLLASGALIAFPGLLIRAWSAGHIRKNKEITVSGPYARTRNPLYLGSFLMGVGFTIAAGVWWLALIFAVLYLGIYLPVMRIEARELTQSFGDEYRKYAEEVPLFIPRLTAYGSSDRSFDGSLYLKYREYQAAVGFLAVTFVLILKIYLIEYYR